MTATHLINTQWADATAHMLIHSIWQIPIWGALLYILLHLIPLSRPNLRYHVAMATMIGAFTSLIFTFANHLGIANSHQVAWRSKLVTTLESSMLTSKSTMSSLDHLVSSYSHYIVGIWMVGIMFLTIRMLYAFREMKILRSSMKPVSPSTHTLFSQLLKIVACKRTVRLGESEHIEVPMTFGVNQPIILLPLGIVTSITPKHLEALLAHELAHIMRHDYIINLAISLIEVILFYHPVIWWMRRQIDREREICCDVLATSWTGSKKNYAWALYAFETTRMKRHSMVMASSGDPKDLSYRVNRLLTIKNQKSKTMEKWLPLVFIAGTIMLLAFTNNVIPELNEEDKQVKSLNSTVEEFRAEGSSIYSLVGFYQSSDTIPKKGKSRWYLRSTQNGKSIELESRNGKIRSLKIDGKRIGPEDYAQYEEEIRSAFSESVPVPPVLPAPPAPPAPPTSPAPPTPPAPPAPPIWDSRDVRIERELEQVREIQSIHEALRQEMQQKHRALVDRHQEKLLQHQEELLSKAEQFQSIENEILREKESQMRQIEAEMIKKQAEMERKIELELHQDLNDMQLHMDRLQEEINFDHQGKVEMPKEIDFILLNAPMPWQIDQGQVEIERKLQEIHEQRKHLESIHEFEDPDIVKEM